MAKEERPLPVPPKAPFGLKRRFEQDGEGAPLLIDRMAAAMTEGKLEEFLESEFSDSEHVRALASMVLGMTGMSPAGGMPAGTGEAKAGCQEPGASGGAAESPPDTIPPDDVLKAAERGDVRGLAEFLEREQRKRVPAEGPNSAEKEEKAGHEGGQPLIEREILDQLVKIASDNNLSLDWVVLRALKLYVRDYAASGRL